MRTRRFLAGGMAVVVAVGLAAAVLQAADIVGTWVGKTEVPDQGVADVTLVVKKTDNGYTGTLADSLGVVATDAGIKDVKFADNKLSFLFTLTDGTVLTMRLVLDGDKLTGQWEHPEGGVGAIIFERKKQ